MDLEVKPQLIFFLYYKIKFAQKEALMRYRSSLVYSAYVANNRSLANITRLADPCAPHGSLVRYRKENSQLISKL